MTDRKVSIEINGSAYEREVEPRLLLSDFIRHEARPHRARTWAASTASAAPARCSSTASRSARACMFAVQARATVRTVEASRGPDGDAAPAAAGLPRDARRSSAGSARPGFLMTLEPFARAATRRPRRARDPRGARRQPVPLHGLPEHRRGGPARRSSGRIAPREDRNEADRPDPSVLDPHAGLGRIPVAEAVLLPAPRDATGSSRSCSSCRCTRGTHFDAEMHIVSGGKDIASVPIDRLCRRGRDRRHLRRDATTGR